jgi:penicillin-insensitive murein endopeptidase
MVPIVPTFLAALLVSLPLAAETVPSTPTAGPAQAIGSPANGCLAGAVALPLSGPGWEVLRPERNRFWGHPALVAFIESVAARTASTGTLLIADMAQPRGGHMTFGHGSHQTGVDVDILFRLGAAPLSAEERSDPDLTGVVRPDGDLDPARWGDAQVAVLRSFATDRRVERIFVNAAIKRTLCRTIRGDRDWLRVLRPWWGHDEHFHVRLSCPPGSGSCIGGPPLPPGDGCGADLDWWFTEEAAKPTPASPPVQPSSRRPAVPAACRAILNARSKS